MHEMGKEEVVRLVNILYSLCMSIMNLVFRCVNIYLSNLINWQSLQLVLVVLNLYFSGLNYHYRLDEGLMSVVMC